MNRILVVTASPRTGGSRTRELAAFTAHKLALDHPEVDIVFRDVGVTPPPHLDHETLTAFETPAERRSARQRDLVAFSDELVSEVERADVLVIGAPLYNFGSPSTLKAWFDHVLRPGRTYETRAEGPKSLAPGRTAYVITAVTNDLSPCASEDCLEQVEPYLRSALMLLGFDRQHFVHAADQAKAGEAAGAGLREARQLLDWLTDAPTVRRKRAAPEQEQQQEQEQEAA